MNLRTMRALAAAGALLMLLPAARGAEPKAAAWMKPDPAALKRWQDMRFGMFIHWGPVSLTHREIGWSRGGETPITVYDNLYKKFNPAKFNADEWAAIAKSAGMKYVVLTTKHHDGFCLFDTKQTDYNIMNTPFGRNVTKELAVACRKQGLGFGAYYSVCDWHHPDFPLTSPGGSVRRQKSDLDAYNRYLLAQIKELVTDCGPLVTIWNDVPQMFEHRGVNTIKMVRELQPDILINDRTGDGGDYSTPEQQIGGFNMERPWESCMTISAHGQWAWGGPTDGVKPLADCLLMIIRAAGGNGNVLLNVGPTPEGIIEPCQVERLKEIGAWLAKNGESIYGTRGGPFKPNRSLVSTHKDNVVYVHVLRWNGETLVLPPLPKKVVKGSLLTGGTVEVAQDSQGITLRVPAKDRQEIDTIVKLELDGPAGDIRPIAMPAAGKVKAAASNVFQQMNDEYGPEMAFDDDPGTRWATDAGTHQAWISAEFSAPRTLCGVRIQEEYGQRVEKFEFQYRDGNQWKTIFSGTTLGKFSRDFPPVVAREVRLNILQASEGPTISEIELIDKK